MSRKTVINFSTIAIAACLGLYLSREPWIAYQQQKSKADAANKEVGKVEQRKTDLQREEASLESPMGRERAARAQGYHLPNEQPVSQGGTSGPADSGVPSH